MFFSYDGRKLTVNGKNLVVETAAGETVISEREPATGSAAAAPTGAKRGRKPKNMAGASSPQTSFEPSELQQ